MKEFFTFIWPYLLAALALWCAVGIAMIGFRMAEIRRRRSGRRDRNA